MNPELLRQMSETQETHWWFRARRQVLRQIIAAALLPADASILEIGCGTGGNLAMLKEHGRVTGIESDDYARGQATAVSGIPVLAGRLPDELPPLPDRFDLVCLFDVLEHVADDAGALRRARELLNRDGRLIVTVPAYRWLFSSHDREHHHYRRYAAGDIAQLASRCGLQILRLGYFNTFLFPLAVAARVMSMLRPDAPAPGVAIPPKPVNELLYRVFAAEAPLARRHLFAWGTSVAAVMRPA
jgi:SAM-dependent methyltransferase